MREYQDLVKDIMKLGYSKDDAVFYADYYLKDYYKNEICDVFGYSIGKEKLNIKIDDLTNSHLLRLKNGTSSLSSFLYISILRKIKIGV